MATTIYEWDTADIGTTGWNAIYKAFTESVDSLLPTYLKVTLGEDVSKGEVLYLQKDGKWYKAIADGVRMPVQGFAIEAGVASASIRIQRIGLLTVATWSLQTGIGVWLDASTRGAITQTKPGSNAQFLGIALTSTSININIAIGDAPSLPMSTTTTTSTTTTSTTTSSSSTTTTGP